MIIVRGTAYFEPGEIERLRPQLNDYVGYVRGLDGCIDYCYGRDLRRPDALHVIEAWRDEAALDAYLADLSRLMDILAGARMERLQVNAYDATFARTILGEPPLHLWVSLDEPPS